MKFRRDIIWIAVGITFLAVAAPILDVARADVVKSHWKIRDGGPDLDDYSQWGGQRLLAGGF